MEDDGDFEKKSEDIRQLGALPPDQLVDHLSGLHNTLDATAPNLSPHIYATAANAIQFLHSKLPGLGNELPQDKLPNLSEAQKRQWLSLHSIVNDPVSILDHIQSGTLNGHHLEALKSVYPDLHQEMSQKILDEVGKGNQIPYQKRLMLSKFLGQPLDSTMTGQSFRAILGAAGPNTGPAAQGTDQSRAGKAGTNLAVSQANKILPLYATATQDRQIDKLKH